jgi:N-acetylglucosamine kinase-like BadF-type ATPase
MSQARYILGIDAGGSTTRCAVVDDGGRIVAFGRGGPANKNFVSTESALSAIEHALNGVLASPSRPIDTVVLSGAHLPPDASDVICKRAGTDIVIGVDEFAACLSAGLETVEGQGVVVMSGTGSFCKGRNSHDEQRYTGGWGPLIGDEGSGYDIGKEALTALARAGDGRGRETMLRELIFPRLHLEETQDLKRRLYNPPLQRHQIAALAPYVFEAADAGDGVALAILRTAGNRLAELAASVMRALFGRDEEFSVVLSGAILREHKIVARALTAEIAKIRPHADVFVSKLRPLSGTLIIGLHSIGASVTPAVIDILKQTEPAQAPAEALGENTKS